MKKHFLFLIVLCYSICTTGQRPPGIANTVTPANKDTTRPGIKPAINSVTDNTGTVITLPNSTTAASSTAITTLDTNNKPLTLEELNKRVLDLESQLNSVKKKLPFQNMAVMTIESSEQNMTSVTMDFTFFKHQIKIDNELSNNNPKAIIFAMHHGDKDKLQTVNAFYNIIDKYWYISVPQLKLSGFQTWGIREGSTTFKIELTTISYPSFQSSQGVAFAKPVWPSLGQKFSVIIFNELPVPRQGLNTIKGN